MTSLPAITREKVEEALDEFDRKLRESRDFSDWEEKLTQKNVLLHDGKRYPPKKIVSMATGVSVGDFWGGPQTNLYLGALGFKVKRIKRATDAPENLEKPIIPSFQIGRVYDRQREINEIYGGSRQSGISASRKTPAIFIFTTDTGGNYGYHDGFDEQGVFCYTGEGQIGDMKPSKGNLAVMEHSRDGRALHVFNAIGKGKGQKYLGEFAYASHEFRDGPDLQGDIRKIIVFHLIPVGLVQVNFEYEMEDEPTAPGLDLDLHLARKHALDAVSPRVQVGTSQARRTLYKRAKSVKDYVILRANGVCESCKNPAPFKRADGRPYLEPHHTTRVSDGGLDHPRHVGAICPNCHCEIHHGENGEARNLQLIQYVESIELL